LGYLRIIGGAHRGRRIAVPRGAPVRPTADRVREALFSILGGEVEGARVLDAYAGSGALGFEALSRGALRATFIEADRRAQITLRATAADLGVENRCEIRHGRAIDLLGHGAVTGPFDLIFADPPYGAAEAGPFLALAAEVLAGSGRIVVERDVGREAVAVAELSRHRTAKYGRCCLDFYRRGPVPDGPERGSGEDPG
jgi:16S rRNA (guanine966-N2)-methyltransferase